MCALFAKLNVRHLGLSSLEPISNTSRIWPSVPTPSFSNEESAFKELQYNISPNAYVPIFVPPRSQFNKPCVMDSALIVPLTAPVELIEDTFTVPAVNAPPTSKIAFGSSTPIPT